MSTKQRIDKQEISFVGIVDDGVIVEPLLLLFTFVVIAKKSKRNLGAA